MKPHVSLTVLLVIFTILASAACTPSTPAAAPAGVATSLSPAPLALLPCKLPGDVAAQCGTLTVYENRSARSGRQIGVRVAVVKATGAAREADPVFWLAGGPGAA